LHFTKREIDIIDMLKFGFSNSEIANKLNISHNTVKLHISNLFYKTNSINRANLLYNLFVNGYFK